ncbi:MAG: PIN domain-containing protein [Candidatus Poribacteria bacterium]|nr:PIN domain-containing protein [Candidatus Poribacteria bacterium]
MNNRARTYIQNLKIYLDTCCLSRPFNDQTQIRIRRETDAIEKIFDAFITNRWLWVVSETLVHEVNNNPNWIERARIKAQINDAHQNVLIGSIENLRGEQLEALGFKWFDALHLACAESSNADIFLTTDDRLLRRAKRLSSELRVRVENPYIWLQGVDRNECSKNDR